MCRWLSSTACEQYRCLVLHGSNVTEPNRRGVDQAVRFGWLSPVCNPWVSQPCTVSCLPPAVLQPQVALSSALYCMKEWRNSAVAAVIVPRTGPAKAGLQNALLMVPGRPRPAGTPQRHLTGRPLSWCSCWLPRRLRAWRPARAGPQACPWRRTASCRQGTSIRRQAGQPAGTASSKQFPYVARPSAASPPARKPPIPRPDGEALPSPPNGTQ